MGNPVTVTFTPTNWNVPQTITVTAVDDDLQEGPQTSVITHTASSQDENFDGLALDNVIVSVADDDEIILEPNDLPPIGDQTAPIDLELVRLFVVSGAEQSQSNTDPNSSTGGGDNAPAPWSDLPCLYAAIVLMAGLWAFRWMLVEPGK